jgi:ribose transport system substrate-binding protein
MKKSSLFASASMLGLGLLMSVAGVSQADAAANCIKGDRKAPYTLGWANIYSVPTWMKQTQGTIEAEVEQLKKEGLVDKLVVTDAQGDANVQIQQIQSMIDADVDARRPLRPACWPMPAPRASRSSISTASSTPTT